MLVNSLSFWGFFLIVLLFYFSFSRSKAYLQNGWLLVASYIFYGYISWAMCGLLAIATVVFYVIGLYIPKIPKKKSYWLTTCGVLLGVGMLFYFKYTHFFLEQISQLLEIIGLKTNWNSFKIVVPIGISFFTFKLISYIVDIYRGGTISNE